MNKTDAHGIVEEPSAKAQVEAMDNADNTVEVFAEDEIAKDPTAEQGFTEEPSAAAQEDMLDQ